MAFGDSAKEFGKTNQTSVGGFGTAASAFVAKRIQEEEEEAEKIRRDAAFRGSTPNLSALRLASNAQTMKEAQARQPLTAKDTEELKLVGASKRGTTLTSPIGDTISESERKPTLFDRARALSSSGPEMAFDDWLLGAPNEKEMRYALTGEMRQPGILGYVAPTLTRTKEDRVRARADALVEAGLDYNTANKIAIEDVENRWFTIKTNKDTSVSLTKEQEKALNSINFWEGIDNVFFTLDIASAGRSKAVRTVAKKGVEETAKVLKGTTKAASVARKAAVVPEADEAIHTILNAVADETADIDKRISTFKRIRGRLADKLVPAREMVEDDLIRLKNLQRKEGVVVTDETDTYTKELLMSGQIKTAIENGRRTTENIVSDILETAKRNNIEESALNKSVNDYLVASHAGERIAEVGVGALEMTKKEAKEILKTIDASDIGAEVKRIAEDIRTLHNKTLDMLRDSGVITDELYTSLRKKYKKHVPLQRIFDDTDDVGGALSAKSGLDVKSTGIKKAKGSEREIGDILENVVYNYEQAVIRSHKNEVLASFARLVRENPAIEGITVRRPKSIGQTHPKKGVEPAQIMETVTDPKTLQYFEKGKKMLIEIEDPRLAAAMSGINVDHLPVLFKGVAALTRFYASTLTLFSPEFAPTNKIRDLMDAVIYAASQGGQGWGAFRVAFDPKEAGISSMNTVRKYLKAQKHPGANADILNSPDVKLYQQMIEDGGTTGGYISQSISDVRLDIEKIRRLRRSNPRMAAKKVLSAIENYNIIFENSTRFSVYKNAIENGASRQKAARMAKEATVNFDKKGTGGPIINALWMFSNASIQGSAKFLRSMKNPKVFGATALTVGTAVMAVNEYNDSIDPEWRTVVTKWDRMNSLPVMLPWKEEGKATPYISIPISWGMKPMKVFFDEISDLTNGEGDGAGDSFERIAQAVVEGYNPVGGADVVSGLVPTFADTIVEVARNKAWHGGKIYPDDNPYAPDSMRFFEDINDTASGRVFKRITRGLSGMGIEFSPETMDYAFTQYIGGTGRFTSKIVDTVSSLAKGEAPESKNIPFFSRFYRERSEEEVGAGSNKSETINNLLTEQERGRLLLLEEAEEKYATLKTLSKEDSERMWKEIRDNDKDLAKAIWEARSDEELGLNYIDRKIKKLGVENGGRARYIYSELQAIEDKDKRNALFKEYARKKLITEEVYEQMNYLRQQDDQTP
jgi:predicted transcriptional regulator